MNMSYDQLADPFPDPAQAYGHAEGADVPDGEVIRLSAEHGAGVEVGEETASTHVRARIVWPALGFPAVIAPNPQSKASPMSQGDATRCVTVLLLSERRNLSKKEAADHLRYVSWSGRGRRHLSAGAGGSFMEEELEVRNDETRPFGAPHLRDTYGEVIVFGGDASGNGSFVVTLANRVRDFYRSQKLPYLHEIRVSEEASARLAAGCYQLFWNNGRPLEDAPSDELALLLQQFAPTRRAALGDLWTRHRQELLDEYEYEYRSLHPGAAGAPTKRRRTEILHPLFVRSQPPRVLRIGHITDTHVDVRADLYGHNLRKAGSRVAYNNWNESFVAGWQAAQQDSDVVLLTGDLIDYGRGHTDRTATQNLGRDELYHVDRNWFLFHDLLASGDSYRVPAYSILGNHDWRINPYPPFAIVGAPAPRLLIHDHSRMTTDEQKRILETAHDKGHEVKLSYDRKAENRLLDALKTAGTLLKALAKLLGQTKSMNVPGSPAETTVESVAWYLFAVNPFFDYSFVLPGGYRILMLDWAGDENVLFPIVMQGEKWPYMLWELDQAADPGPKAARSLTDLQTWLVTRLIEAGGKAKIIGIHAAPIGPYPDWLDHDLLLGRKTYASKAVARGPTNYAVKRPDGTVDRWNGHPIFAVTPRSGDAGVAADYGSLTRHRDWFLKQLSSERSGVRAVLSGHIHRNGLFIMHRSPRSAGALLENELLVRLVVPAAVRGAKPPAVALTPEGGSGPLFISTTSGGPRGNDYSRAQTDLERRSTGGLSVDPGYARLDISPDGRIERVEFRSSLKPVPATRELGIYAQEDEFATSAPPAFTAYETLLDHRSAAAAGSDLTRWLASSLGFENDEPDQTHPYSTDGASPDAAEYEGRTSGQFEAYTPPTDDNARDLLRRALVALGLNGGETAP